MTKHFSKIIAGFVALASVCKAPSDGELRAMAKHADSTGDPAAGVFAPAGMASTEADRPVARFNADMTDGNPETEDIEESLVEQLEEEPEEMTLPSTIDGRWDTPETTKRGFTKKDFIDIKVKLTGDFRFKVYGNLKVSFDVIRAPAGLITDQNLQDLIEKKKKNQQAMIQKKILEQALNQALMQQFAQEKTQRSKRPRRSGNRSGVIKKLKTPVAY